MRRLELDFVAAPPRPPLAWLVFALGALLLAPAADRYLALADRLDNIQGQLAHLQRQAGKGDTNKEKGEASSRDLREKRERALIAQVSAGDWAIPLHAVEQAIDEHVALVSLNQEGNAHRFRLQGEVKAIDDALGFAERLRQAEQVEDVQLTTHDTKKSTGIEVIGFGLSMKWRPSK